MRASHLCLASALICLAVHAQTVAKFDVTDVHPSPKRRSLDVRGGVLQGTRFEMRNASVVDMIAFAFNLQAEKIAGGPSWIEMDKFDIAGKAVPGTSRDQLRLMMRGLLADRFALKVHEEKRAQPAFALNIVKGGKHKLKEATAEGTNCRGANGEQAGGVPLQVLTCQGAPMETLLDLIRQAGNLNATVIDKTGLTGRWDFEIKFTNRIQLAVAGADGIPFADALEQQLGLTLDSQTADLPVTLVDSVNRQPTPNAPDVAQTLPPAPIAEFEVSTVRPSRPDSAQNGNFGNGRLDIQGLSLRDIIIAVWDVTEEMIANAPPFLATAKYDITAKASSDNVANSQIDQDTLFLMVQKLMQERFDLKVHFEDREVNAYSLRQGKPKLKAADPSARSKCQEGPAAAARDARDSTPIRSRLITCTNVTMEQFAERLQPMATGYLRAPVANETGLQGGYDISLSFSPVGVFRQLEAQRAAGNANAAADPTAAISLFDAVDQQLGLKLEQKKRRLPVLVIDHINEQPSEN